MNIVMTFVLSRFLEKDEIKDFNQKFPVKFNSAILKFSGKFAMLKTNLAF